MTILSTATAFLDIHYCLPVLSSACLSELRKELPRVSGRKRRGGTLVDLRGIVITIMNDPRQRVPLLATSVDSLDRVAAAGLGFACEFSTPIVGDKSVADLATLGNVENGVFGAMLAVVGDGLRSPRAAA